MKKPASILFVLSACVLLFVSMVLPRISRARMLPSMTPASACVNNLRKIKDAKTQAADENGWTEEVDCDDTTIRAIVNQHIPGKQSPVCREGGVYQYGKFSENPVCSKKGKHTVQ
jgi:hypothetical protein